MNVGIEIGEAANNARPPFTPERAIELKEKARELFVQGFEYLSTLNESSRSAARAKPVWE